MDLVLLIIIMLYYQSHISHSLCFQCIIYLFISNYEGFLCNCVLPAGLNETKVRHIRAEEGSNTTEKKLRSQSSRFASASKSQPPLTSRSSSSTSRKNTSPGTNVKPLTIKV